MDRGPRFMRPDVFRITYKDDAAKLDKLADGEYVGSFCPELIKNITRIKCLECGEKLMTQCKDVNAPPMTGYCGHIFCFNCAKQLHCKFLAKYMTQQISVKDRELEFGVECDGSSNLLDIIFLHCTVEINEDDVEVFWKGVKAEDRRGVNPFLILFEVNSMLKNLYDALRQPGILCKYKDERNDWKICGIHPLKNSLHCVPCSDNSREDRDTCMWHAKYHKDCKSKTGHKGLLFMASNPESEEYGRRKSLYDPDIDNHLATPDRENRTVYAALYHCGRCGNTLTNDKKNRINIRPHHLKCGHFVGPKCVEKAHDEMLKGGVYCIFCKNYFTTEKDVMPVFPLSQTLADLVLNYHGKFSLDKCAKKCRRSGCTFKPCNTRFPARGNFLTIDQRCTFCEVEHQLECS